MIPVFPKFNWNLLCAGCDPHYSPENLTQNVYNGKFSNVDNELIVTNVRN